MSDKVKLNLKKVIADNWKVVIDLGLDADQEDLVEHICPVAETQFDSDARQRAVYT